MKTTTTTTKARTASKSALKETTTIELDANLVAKARASLRAIRRNQTLEEFLGEELTDILMPENGFFPGLISTCDDDRRTEMEAKLARIGNGDRRLVHPEPSSRNASVYSKNLERLRLNAAAADIGLNSVLNYALDYVLEKIERGELRLVPNTPEKEDARAEAAVSSR